MCKKLQAPYRGFAPIDSTGGLPSPEHPDWPVFILGFSWGNLPKNQKSPKIRRDREPDARIHAKILVPICYYCLNCTKFGQLILRKIFKIVATRCQTLRLKCTKFDFGWGSAPDPARELTALPRPSWI